MKNSSLGNSSSHELKLAMVYHTSMPNIWPKVSMNLKVLLISLNV